MPQLDITTYSSQIFWFLICFFSMLIIMYTWIVPLIAEKINERQKNIDNDLDQATKVKEKAEEAYSRYNEALEKATAKANKSLEAAQQELKETISKRQEELSERLNKKILEGEAAIEKSKKTALTKVIEISENVAVEIINRIDVKKVTPKDIKEAIKVIEEK